VSTTGIRKFNPCDLKTAKKQLKTPMNNTIYKKTSINDILAHAT